MKTSLQILTLAILTIPFVAWGQYSPLVEIPVSGGGEAGFSDYIQTLYVWSISIAALLAVVKIMIAGVKYMLTDNVSSKGSALSDIKAALFGLLLIAAAVLILTTINPALVSTTLSLTPAPEADIENTNPGVSSVGDGSSTVNAINDSLEEQSATSTENNEAGYEFSNSSLIDYSKNEQYFFYTINVRNYRNVRDVQNRLTIKFERECVDHGGVISDSGAEFSTCRLPL